MAAVPIDYQQFGQQIALVVQHATEILGSHDAALRWLEAPNAALGGAVPLNLLTSGDPGTITQVGEILVRIEHGMYS